MRKFIIIAGLLALPAFAIGQPFIGGPQTWLPFLSVGKPLSTQGSETAFEFEVRNSASTDLVGASYGLRYNSTTVGAEYASPWIAGLYNGTPAYIMGGDKTGWWFQNPANGTTPFWSDPVGGGVGMVLTAGTIGVSSITGVTREVVAPTVGGTYDGTVEKYTLASGSASNQLAFGQPVYMIAKNEVSPWTTGTTQAVRGLMVSTHPVAGVSLQVLTSGAIGVTGWAWTGGTTVYGSSDPLTLNGLTQTEDLASGSMLCKIGTARNPFVIDLTLDGNYARIQ